MLADVIRRLFRANNNVSGDDYGLLFSARLQTDLRPQKANGSNAPTFTRATTGYVEDFEGLLKPVLSGEARFKGARRVYNQLTNSGFTGGGTPTGWGAPGGTGTSTVVGTASDGSKIYQQAATAQRPFFDQSMSLAAYSTYKLTMYIDEFVSGTLLWNNFVTILGLPSGATFTYADGAGGSGSIAALSGRVLAGTIVVGATAGSATLRVGVGTASNSTATVSFSRPQLENVTGQSNQNPGEYVNSGVLSAPYHGAGVDGVKWFTTHNGNTVSSNVVTEATGPAIGSANSKFLVFPGESSSYVAAGNRSVTGDFTATITFRVEAAPTANAALIQKLSGNNGFQIRYLTNNIVQLQVGDGASVTAISLPDMTAYLRQKVTVTVNWYDGIGASYSVNGGAESAVSPAAKTLTNSATPFLIAPISSGSVPCRVYRVTVAGYDCDPNNFSSGSDFSSGGDTYALAGNAKVFGGSGSSSIAAPWDSRGPYGYFAEGARTNELQYSQDLTNAAHTQASLASAANNVTDPFGTTTGCTLTEDTLSARHGSYQAVTVTADTVGVTSRFIKAGTRRYVIVGIADGLNSAYACVDTTTMTITEAGAEGTGTYTASGIQLLPNGWARVWVAGIAKSGSTTAVSTLYSSNTATPGTHGVSFLGDGSTLISTGAQYGKAASFASSYIPTTTAAVTRNADVLTYAVAGNIVAAVGSVYCEPRCESNGAQQIAVRTWVYNPGDGNSGISLEPNNSTNFGQLFAGGQGSADGSALTSTATASITKMAARWSVNDLAVYVNGAKEGTDSSAAVPSSLTNATLKIGSDAGSAALFGTIRNVRIYGRALSDAQLQAMTT